MVELLVSIAIIGVLAVIGFATYTNGLKSSRDGQRKNDLKAVQNALELAKQDTAGGTYPVSFPVAMYPSNSAFTYLITNSLKVKSYIQKTPADPTSTGVYSYRYISDGNTYTLESCLENSNDAQKDQYRTYGGATPVAGATACTYARLVMTNP